ncbi:hypothetical protein DV738_g2008, partial [Chaetothyriales sp. CBS 135597]
MDTRTCLLRPLTRLTIRSRAVFPFTLSPPNVRAVQYSPDKSKDDPFQAYHYPHHHHQQRRHNSQLRRNVSSAVIAPAATPPTGAASPPSEDGGSPPAAVPRASAMSCLPLGTVIRSYFINAVSSYPLLLQPSLAALSFLAHSKSPIFSPDRNPLLRFLLKGTFYAQFCAGETPTETRKTIADLKEMGYKGIILGHAKEVVLSEDEIAELDKSTDSDYLDQINQSEILDWKQNTLDTIELASEDDFIALKFSGAGRQALKHLRENIPCASAFEQAVHEICRKAQERGVGLLFDAEQASIQDGIDRWTLYFAEKYNRGDKALVFGTYQAYRKSVPGLLAKHLEIARRDNFILGVKLVRGAYLGSDPRELFWPTIEDTHNCYNGIAKALMEQKFNNTLKPAEGSSGDFPRINLVLASHNAESVRLAQQLRDEQAASGAPRIRMGYGQLMGMADNVSCELVQAANEAKASGANKDIPQAYKYLVWGTMSECMKYLLRRAQENKDAVMRTEDAKRALRKELGRRLGLETMDSAMPSQDANMVLSNVLTQLDQVVEHLRCQSENAAANEIAIKAVDIVKAFNDATAPWDMKKFFMTPQQMNGTGTSWASVAAKRVAEKDNKWIKFGPTDGIKNQISESAGEKQEATVEGLDKDRRVVWISGWGADRPLSDVTTILSHGPIFSMIYSPENNAVCVIFEHAASAKAVCQDESYHRQHEGMSMFGSKCTVWVGLPYPEDGEIRRMASPIYERRRLTFVRSQLFGHGLTEEKFRRDMEQEVGAKNIELIWLFNTGNATVVFTSTANARRVRDQFRAKAKQYGPYRDVQISFSHDPCEKPLNLITQIEQPAVRSRAISGGSALSGSVKPGASVIKTVASSVKSSATSGTGVSSVGTSKREKIIDADGPPPRRTTNPNAPKTHDRGPPSSESTQTDFSKLDIFQSFNIPVPATSIDACTGDGFHLNNDVKITDHDGVLLVGGEAFAWNSKRTTLTLTPQALSLLAVLHPKPDLLLLGTGARLWMLSRATRHYLNAELGIRVDIMDTANASSAYNLLAQERGVEQGSGVGAALLPLSWNGGGGGKKG